MTSDRLWQPSGIKISQSQLTAFMEIMAKKFAAPIDNYTAFHRWSVERSEDFWSGFWDFASINASVKGNAVLVDANRFPGARWFPESRLNFAENLLSRRDEHLALIGLDETGSRRTLSYTQLFDEVEALAAAMRMAGVVKGDRVAGFMSNIMETVVAMLAAASIGAIWSSCSPDFGVNGAKDRFSQIAPKLLFAVDAYPYNGKVVDCLAKVQILSRDIGSIEKVIIVNMAGHVAASLPENFDRYETFKSSAAKRELTFEQLPFDHPLYIMYSSGTTGTPKCIVHGAGGTLLQHKKELLLHTDLSEADVLFYFTTCGWMMWNWLVSGLSVGATLVLYEGSPFARDGHVLLDAIDAEGITVFGVGAKYIASLEKAGITPRQSHRLTTLRTILSTGSPLSENSFDYVYRDIKGDVCLASISGGTDIISCFVLGNPNLPVYKGEIQCLGLGMGVEMWNDNGEAVTGEKGELVCTVPFPSMPIGFWNDAAGERFRQAYFARYDGVWAHGDYGEITPQGGVIIHGRSDAVLNPGGVRIGTAEIYRQVEKVDAVVDSVVIGQKWEDDERVVLFVVLREGLRLTPEIEAELRQGIRQNATPRHVPAKIVQVGEIPRTISGKIVELAVKQVVHGEVVKNTDALANPEALEQFRELNELKS